MNSAYKHLDSKLRIAELSVGQWITVLGGLALAIAWGLYLSPLGPSLTLVSSIYLVALPTAAALFASLTEFDPWLLIRSALSWRRHQGRYLPGPGSLAGGYWVHADADAAGRADPELAEMDIEALWEERQ